jgi:hypothetical protein
MHVGFTNEWIGSPNGCGGRTKDAWGWIVLDRWDVSIACETSDAVELFDDAVHDYVAFGTESRALTTRALALAPEFVLAECLMAYLDLFTYTRAGVERARTHLQVARNLLETGRGGDREAAHVTAATRWCVGDLTGAVRIWERNLLSHPTDLLAIRLAHDGYYFLGDALNLRDSPARVLPAWSDDVSMASYVRAMHAFGLEECGSYREAEVIARESARADPADVWAHHCVSHVLEMEGRAREGDAYMRASREWWESSGFPNHLWWHWSLFQLDLGDYDGALATMDDCLAFNLETSVLELVDSTSLLWRLFLLGRAPEPLRAALADAQEQHVDEAVYAFNDMHTAMALAMANRDAPLNYLTSVMTDQSAGDHQRMCRDAGLSVVRGIGAFAAGEYQTSVDELLETRYRARVLGGSNAQRDVLNLTLIAAAAKDENHRLVEALRAERLATKPGADEPLARLIAANS